MPSSLNFWRAQATEFFQTTAPVAYCLKSPERNWTLSPTRAVTSLARPLPPSSSSTSTMGWRNSARGVVPGRPLVGFCGGCSLRLVRGSRSWGPWVLPTHRSMGKTCSGLTLNHSPLRFNSGRILWKASSTASMSSTRTDSTMSTCAKPLPPRVLPRRTGSCVRPTLQ